MMKSPIKIGRFLLSLGLPLALLSVPGWSQEVKPTIRKIVESTYHRLEFDRDLERVAVANTDLLSMEVLNSREILAHGKKIGRTSAIIWFKDGTMQQFVFAVHADLSILEDALRDIHPSLRVETAPDRDALVLRGLVPDITYSRSAEAAAQGYLDAGGRRREEAGQPVLGGQEETGLTGKITDTLRPPAEFKPSGTVINLIRVETLPKLMEEKIQDAIAAVGGEGVTIRRVVRGDIRNDEIDILILEGSVADQVTLVRVLSIASRLFLGEAVSEDSIEVISDEGGSLVQGGSGTASNFSGISGQLGGAGGGGGGNPAQSLQNQIENNVARATALGIADGRILSFIQVDDLPQVRVDIKLYEISRTKLFDFAANLTGAVSDFDQPDLLAAGGATAIQGDEAARVGADSQGSRDEDVQNVLGILGGTLTNQFQVSGNHYAIDSLFSILETKGIARRLSEPSLTVLSGETAVFQVGGEIPISVAFTPAFGGDAAATPGVFNSVLFRSFGIQLGIRPLVGLEDMITLEVAPQIVNPDDQLTTLLRESTGNTQATTAFETRSLKTSSRLQDGQTLILGGLTRRFAAEDLAQTPWLADIPLLGYLFKGLEGESQEEQELIIVVNPVILRDPIPNLAIWNFQPIGELLEGAGL